MVRHRKLDIGIGRDLNPIATRIMEIKEPTGHDVDVHFNQRLLHQFHVVDGDAEMLLRVRGLAAPLGEMNELIAEANESGGVVFALQFEV